MTISARNLGMEVVRTSAGEELVRCPFHIDNSPSAWFNPAKGLFYCAVCSIGLNLVQLKERLALDIELDASIIPENLPDFDLMTETPLLPRGEFIWNDYFGKRGLNFLISSYYGLEWREDAPTAAVLPITNLQGEVIGVMHRYIDPKAAGTRYKIFGETTPVWPMSVLRFLHEGQEVIITEGAWSAMKISKWYAEQGILNQPLALLGAKANQRIVDVLRPFKPIFLYDNDKAGRNACRKMRSLFPLASSYTLSTSPDDRSASEIGSMVDSINRRVK